MLEVKELLRDPEVVVEMILVPLLMFPITGFAIQASRGAALGGVATSMAVLNLDRGPVTQGLVAFLRGLPNVDLVELSADCVDEP